MPSSQMSTGVHGVAPTGAIGIGCGTHGREPRAMAIGRKPVQSSPLNGAMETSVGPVTTSDGLLPHVVFTFQTCTT